MTLWLALAGVIVAWVVFTLWRAFASRRLLVIRVERGKIVRAWGRVPPDFYAEVVDVLERAKASGAAEVRIEAGSAIVIGSPELGASVEQRLRNVVGRFPMAKLRAGRPVRQR